MASTTDSTLESEIKAPNRFALRLDVQRIWADAADGFLVSVLKVARAIVTEFGNMACREYGIVDASTRPGQEFNAHPLWFGRPVIWTEGFQHRHFELTRFSAEHGQEDRETNAFYRVGIAK